MLQQEKEPGEVDVQLKESLLDITGVRLFEREEALKPAAKAALLQRYEVGMLRAAVQVQTFVPILPC